MKFILFFLDWFWSLRKEQPSSTQRLMLRPWSFGSHCNGSRKKNERRSKVSDAANCALKVKLGVIVWNEWSDFRLLTEQHYLQHSIYTLLSSNNRQIFKAITAINTNYMDPNDINTLHVSMIEGTFLALLLWSIYSHSYEKNYRPEQMTLNTLAYPNNVF